MLTRLCAAFALVCLALVLGACASAGTTHHYVLIAEPAARATLLPTVVQLRVGDALEIRNNDRVPRQIGALMLAPGESFQQQFRSAGHFEYACSAHASGRLTVVVQP
jgi:plastocyanin